MANIRSQKKRNKTNEKKRLTNHAYKSAMRTAMKRCIQAFEANDLENAKTYLSLAYKRLDKAAGKGIVHKNFANRHKAKLAKRLAQ